MNEIIEYNITDARIEKMREEYTVLKLQGVNDIEGFKKIVVYRKEVKTLRTSVEAKRKLLKADALTYGKEVDAEAKRITSLLMPIEAHLIEQENIVKNEKERIKAEEVLRQEEKQQAKIKMVIGAGAVFDGMAYLYNGKCITAEEIREVPDEGFDVLIQEIKLWKKEMDLEQAEADRIQKEKKEEQDRIFEQQKKAQEEIERKQKAQDQKEAELKAAQDKVDEDKRQLAEDKRVKEAEENAKKEAEAQRIADAEDAKNKAAEKDKQHKIDLEKAKKKAADDAKKEVEKKAKAKLEADKKAQALADKKARLLPDKEKLLALAEKFLNPNLPDIKTLEGKDIIQKIKLNLVTLGTAVKGSANNL